MSIVETSYSSMFARGGRMYPKAVLNNPASGKEKADSAWKAAKPTQTEHLASGKDALIPENIAASSSMVQYADFASEVTVFARRRYYI